VFEEVGSNILDGITWPTIERTYSKQTVALENKMNVTDELASVLAF
jgi:hypothetical protein